MAVIKKKAQGGRGMYATLAQIVNYANEHGYELRWPTDVKDGRLYVNTMIRRQGEIKWEDTCCWIPVEVGDSRGMSVMQALGSALTYAERYSTLAAFGLATTDDDGETSGYRRHGSDGMTGEQQAEIDRILNEYKVAPGFESQFISKVLNRGVMYKQLTGLDAQQFIDSYNNSIQPTTKEENNEQAA